MTLDYGSSDPIFAQKWKGKKTKKISQNVTVNHILGRNICKYQEISEESPSLS